MSRRPYCTHARLESDPDDGRGCPSCAVEAQYPEAFAYGRAKRREDAARGVARTLAPFVVVIVVVIALGLLVGAVGGVGTPR